MAFAPLRFLHAADARLDQAIGETSTLSPRLASLVQDATRAAFDRLIALALKHEVDFVLLAGNTFVEADRSLAARLALWDAFERLDESGIRALILPGPLDPADAWRRIPDLPENVTLLESGPRGIVAVRRDDKVIARVGAELVMPARKKPRTLRDELRSASQRAVPFKIAAIFSAGDAEDAATLRDWCPDGQPESPAIESGPGASRQPSEPLAPADAGRRVAVDYVALGGGAERRTIARRRGVAHDPGPLQGRGPEHAGPHGCTLVSVEQDGTLRNDFLPAASVRWERYVVEVPAPFDRNELLARCRRELEGLRPETCEHAWIFHWILRGDRPAIDLLEDESVCRQLRQDLANATTVPNADNAVHHLVIEPDAGVSDPSESADPVHADFLEALAGCRNASTERLRACVNELRAIDANWADELESFLADLSLPAIHENANEWGRQLFSAGSGQGAAR
jgi:DNA repair protein SbcD/Mre11